jgi:hypothetical protein
MLAAAATAASTDAQAAPWSLRPEVTLPAAGYCLPANDAGAQVPQLVGAAGLAPMATAPIAILDDGVDGSVPELAGRVLAGIDATNGGQPFSGDRTGHGTAVAGLAAGAGPGVVGVSPGSPILPVRIYDATGAATSATIARAIGLAVDRGAKTVLISGWAPASGATADDVRALSAAVDDALSRGAVVVGPGGGTGDATTATLPSILPHVLIAGSLTLTSVQSTFSSQGPYVDVMAPGEGVVAPQPSAMCGFGYGLSTGTSFAAASLAGAVALLQKLHPSATAAQLFTLARAGSATDLGVGGRDDATGYGLLNVAAGAGAAVPAVSAAAPEVDDDPHWLRGRYAAKHPKLLTRTKLRFSVQGDLSPAKDPADVFPVTLSVGDRLVVNATAADPAAILELDVLDPRAGDYDVTDDADQYVAAGTGGYVNDPEVDLRATRAGTYYIAVQPVPVDDAGDDGTGEPVPDLVPYRLSAYKQPHRAKRKARKR